MTILKYRISRRHTLLAGKRWILWQSGEIVENNQHLSFVLLFEKYLKVLLPDFWFLVDDPRACDGLPDVEQGLAGVPVETGVTWIVWYLISLGWTHILTIFSRSRAAASSRRGTWLAGSVITGISTHREAQWVILLVFVFCESPFSLFDLRERRLRMHTLYTVHCYTIYTVTIQARREELDLEANVCAKSATSLQILPHLTKVSSILSHLSKAYWVNIIRWCMFNIMFINHAFSSWSPKLSTCVPSSRERLPLAVFVISFIFFHQIHLTQGCEVFWQEEVWLNHKVPFGEVKYFGFPDENTSQGTPGSLIMCRNRRRFREKDSGEDVDKGLTWF